MLGLPNHRSARLSNKAKATAATVSTWRVAILIAALPLFSSAFQYVIDAPVLYALSKAWPLLTFPLALWAATRIGPGYQPLILACCVWLIAAVPFISVIQLGNDAVGAVASSVKVWPMTGALGLLALLTMLRPTPDDLKRAILVLAGISFVFLAAAWFLAPDTLFNQTIETTKVFLADPERGRRINAPMMYAILGLFILNRSLWSAAPTGSWPRLFKAALILMGLIMMATIYKQRAQIGGTVVVLGLGAIFSWGRWRMPGLLVMVAVILAAIVPAGMWLAQGAVESLGGSLSIRQIEAEAAINFLNAEPWRWITGVGSAGRIGNVTLSDIVGTPFFFPSDLGWLGVVFEYGVIGAGLMLALHLVAIRNAGRIARSGGVLERGLFDYALFLLVVSPVVSVVLQPGEMATILALCGWLAMRRCGVR